ncbi:hypothetical protein H310_09336 [Aphanomyces invadans]|uniref:Uncharacterized protein n=1 Tax=Aphanomyces invadans TaxID=157072 RepID=A0A024TXH5_9STRA|nr:hypothetical protein H310_09336 [Aphanomyces invadans]ETV98042.1 hypothetical protein H310_09336 [Aphanomyces invadans]|eukprot:XP_008873603.1 hypothetical protein H310_09336 [Aphanomyces invadans]
MELYLEKLLDSARQLNQRQPVRPSLALSKWNCHHALAKLSRESRCDDGDDRRGASVRPVTSVQMKFHSKLLATNHNEDNDTDDDDPSIRQHIQRYSQHYQGLEAYGKTGMTKLQQIIDTATSVQQSCRAANDQGVTIGVAVLSSSGRVYTSSSNDLCLDTCPERLAFMKLASDESDFVVEGAAISSSDGLFTPYPCGSCREFLSQFGDFPLYLIRATMEFDQTTAYALFPRGHVSALPGAATASVTHRVRQKEVLKPRHLLHTKDWTVAHAIDWLVEDVGLPEYATTFDAHQVDGATLSYLEESDLQYLLHVQHPLHRKRMALCLHRLRDQDGVHGGVEYGQLKDYLAVLDKDRIEVVVKLKEAFDQVDTNRNGVLDFSEIKQALAAMHYDSSASAVETWIQSRSNSTTVSFPEFALAFCHAWTANTRTLPVPKVDLKSVRAAFDRMDTNGNGTLDKAEVAQALSALGQANADDEAAKWFDQVDADGSNSLSFSEFLVRYAELQFSLAPLQSCFDAITGGGDHVNVVALPQMFRSLQVLYDRPKLDKWTDARLDNSPSEQLSFADFCLAYFLFVQAPAPVESDEERHRHRIVQLQQSGHVRLCTRPSSSTVRAAASRPKQRRGNHDDETKSNDSDDDDDGKHDEGDEKDDEFAAVHKMFHRFHESSLTTLEAMQAITELGVVVPRAQMLQYFTSQGFGTKREIEYEDLVRAYRKLQHAKPTPIPRNKGSVAAHTSRMNAIKALLEGQFGIPYTQQDFAREERKVENDDDSSLMSQREWMQEMQTWVSKRRRRRQAVRRDEAKDDDSESSRSNSCSPTKPAPFGRFQVGDRVVDKTRSMGPGTIIRMSGAYQVCTVHFDSGIKRHNVAMASLRRFRPAPLAAFRVKMDPFQVDAHVQVLYKGTKAIRRGRVKRVRDNDEYDVVYSDGEVEKHVAQKHMSRVAGGKQEAWKEGMQVEARGGDSATYYRGEIVRCRTNDTFDIKFKNGAEEDKVPRKWIRPYSKALKNGTSPTHKHEVPFQVLDVVEARFGGKAHGAYFRGQIAKCRGGGTYDITYDDGDVEKEVSADSIRFVSLEAVARGQAVEARFGGNDKFYPGTIARVHGDGSVDIEYADGDRETRVPSRYVRVSASKAKTQPSFEAGDAVEARFGGQDKYFPGKIARVHSDGTVDIHYADGDKESRVIASLVRPSKKTTDATTYDDDDFE